MIIQSNRVLASLTNGPWLISSVLSLQKNARLSKFVQLAIKKTMNYVLDLSLLTSVWLARYIVWREMHRRRRQS